MVPSPNVSEDHQTYNAIALVKKQAAKMVKDVDAMVDLINISIKIIHDDEKLKSLSDNIFKLSKANASDDIGSIVLKAVNEK